MDGERKTVEEEATAISRAARELLPDLKKELAHLADGVDDDQLLKFLYWKQDVNRAAGRYRDFIKWKTSNPGIFDESLRLTKDPELERVVAGEILVSPPKLLTKQGETILIARMRNNDMTDGRTVDTLIRSLFYTIDAVLDRPETQLKGVVVIHDLRGVDKKKNFSMEVAKRLYQGLFGQFPIHINAIYICYPPAFMKAFFALISNLFMSKKVRERIKFVDSLEDLIEHDVIDNIQELIPDLGGALEWSITDWIEEQKEKERNGTRRSLADINPPSNPS